MQPRGATTLGEQAPAPRLRPLRGHSLGHHASAWLWACETVDLQSINVECMVRIRGLTNVHSTSSSSREVEQQSCTTSSPSRCSGRNACAWASSSRTRPCPSSTTVHVHVRSQGGHSIVAVNAKGQVCPCASAMLPVNKKRKRRPRYSDRTLSVDSHPARAHVFRTTASILYRPLLSGTVVRTNMATKAMW